MAVSFTLLSASLASTANQSTAYTGNAGTAQSQDMLIAFTSCSGNATIGTMSGGGLTWTLLTSQTKNAGADVCGVFWAFVTTGASITPAYTPNAAATGCIMAVVRVAGSTASASGPNLQQAIATDTGTTANPTATFGTTTLTTNGILLFVANGTNSSTQFTAPAGFTELDEVSYNTPANGGEVASRISGGVSNPSVWTNANTTSWRTFGLEFVASVATSFDPMGMMGFFGL